MQPSPCNFPSESAEAVAVAWNGVVGEVALDDPPQPLPDYVDRFVAASACGWRRADSMPASLFGRKKVAT